MGEGAVLAGLPPAGKVRGCRVPSCRRQRRVTAVVAEALAVQPVTPRRASFRGPERLHGRLLPQPRRPQPCGLAPAAGGSWGGQACPRCLGRRVGTENSLRRSQGIVGHRRREVCRGAAVRRRGGAGVHVEQRRSAWRRGGGPRLRRRQHPRGRRRVQPPGRPADNGACSRQPQCLRRRP